MVPTGSDSIGDAAVANAAPLQAVIASQTQVWMKVMLVYRAPCSILLGDGSGNQRVFVVGEVGRSARPFL